MKKIAYLICASGLFSSAFLHAGTLTRMNNTAHWGGWYTGLNLGGWWDRHDYVQATGTPGSNRVINPGLNPSFSSAVTNVAKANPDGLITGFQVSYNQEYRYTYLVGVEADLQWLLNKNNIGRGSRSIALTDSPSSIDTNLALTKSTRVIGTVRARAGYMMTPKWLIYGTGGLGYGMANLGVAYTAHFKGYPGTARNLAISKTGAINYLLGWSAGGGIEWMYKKNWVARIEMLCINLGSIQKKVNLTQYSDATTPPSPYSDTQVTIKVPFNQAVARVALSYRFA